MWQIEHTVHWAWLRKGDTCVYKGPTIYTSHQGKNRATTSKVLSLYLCDYNYGEAKIRARVIKTFQKLWVFPWAKRPGCIQRTLEPWGKIFFWVDETKLDFLYKLQSLLLANTRHCSSFGYYHPFGKACWLQLHAIGLPLNNGQTGQNWQKNECSQIQRGPWRQPAPECSNFVSFIDLL